MAPCRKKNIDSMGVLPNRKYAVVSKNGISSSNENVLVFPSIENALKELSKVTDHVYVSGGGQIYNSLIEKADIIHLSTVHVEVEGDIKFPIMPENFNLVFEQFFMSNINYTYQIWKKRLTMRCSTSRFAPWTAFKSRLCGFAAQKYSTKPQLKSCR